MSTRPMYLRGRWLVGHIIVVVLVAAMIGLGVWQLQRLGERKERNRTIEAGLVAPPADVTSANRDSIAQFRKVRVSGSWDAANTYLVRYPIRNGASGYYVIEPMILDDGTSLSINRGWIPLEAGKRLAKLSDADGGSADITGLMRDAQTKRGTDGVNDSGVVTRTAIDTQYVQLVGPVDAAAPVNGATPTPLDPPDITNGPHMSYALQWFSFCIIVSGGWVILLRRNARELRQST